MVDGVECVSACKRGDPFACASQTGGLKEVGEAICRGCGWRASDRGEVWEEDVEAAEDGGVRICRDLEEIAEGGVE